MQGTVDIFTFLNAYITERRTLARFSNCQFWPATKISAHALDLRYQSLAVFNFNRSTWSYAWRPSEEEPLACSPQQGPSAPGDWHYNLLGPRLEDEERFQECQLGFSFKHFEGNASNADVSSANWIFPQSVGWFFRCASISWFEVVSKSAINSPFSDFQ